MNQEGRHKVLVVGAGRSVHGVLQYFEDHLDELPCDILLVDHSLEHAEQKATLFSCVKAAQLDILNEVELSKFVGQADVVISMVPAVMHIHVAKACLSLDKNLFTASYVSDDILALDDEVKQKGLIFLMECGLDPGIDHMSAQKIIDEIHEQGGEIISFKSYTGGLVAPESDNNPWNYKFTWNPKNVVLAGAGVVKFIRNGLYKYIPYHEVFNRTDEVRVEGYGDFEAYPNRDSLKYRHIYGIDKVPTILRGTLRRPGFCEAWNVLVQLGMTDDSYSILIPPSFTFRDFTNTFLSYHSHFSVEDKLGMYFGLSKTSEVFKKLEWLGLFEKEELPEGHFTPADIVLRQLEKKWTLEPDDKDMVVMQHQFKYSLKGETKQMSSSMVSIGKNAQETSMAQTVGLPLAMATRLYLEGRLELSGVVRPTSKSIYFQILLWLEKYGVSFKNLH